MTAEHGDVWRSPKGEMELWCGRWQDVLAHVAKCDAVVTDPPYSERTHKGQRSKCRPRGGGGEKPTINYQPTDEPTARELASWATGTARHWALIFSDHVAQRWYNNALCAAGWYVFAPVVWVRNNPTPRFAGDGPTSSCDCINVARPKRRLRNYASRPGHYITEGSLAGCNAVPGGKPLSLMRAIVKDYSRPGDLIVDPCAGGGTTLLAAAIEGRRCIGAELDPETFDKAVVRLSRGYTPSFLPLLEGDSLC